jgi:hypothetical protein
MMGNRETGYDKSDMRAEDTMILAFRGNPRHGTALGGGDHHTVRARCVSLP